MDEILRLIDSYWKFDEMQQPISSWHDKQDLLKAISQVKLCIIPNVSKSICKHKHNKYVGKLLKCDDCGEIYKI